MATADSNDDDEFREFNDPLVRKFLCRRQRQNKESSVENDKTVFRQYLPMLGEKSVEEAEFPDVVDFVDQLVDKGCPESTIRVYLSSISKLHQYLNRFHDANMPGVANIPEMYNNLNDPHERKPLDRDEVRQLIDATQSLRDALIIGYLYYTGNRASIPAKLKLRDVDLEAGTIYIDNLKNSGEREISIHDDIEFLLRVWLTEEREAYPPASESPYVFVGEQSAERLCKERIWKIVHEAAGRAGIQEVVGQTAHDNNIYKVTTHVLRHSFATHGFEDGMTKGDLAAFLGQENEESVEVYIESNEIGEAVKAYNSSYEGI
ncbi:tyrosine-type recombinase/integrase [Halorubrum aethiopicum]|uniref:tyrosine-type recombinase/integrase n=1 Tax=Halorubrum aethiopicum TaxID=1758255 RepID=UPI00082B3680|nr:tyrosine-type recombinase/integrase [Halorubrum aethiopicum]